MAIRVNPVRPVPGCRQSWLFPTDFGLILSCFGLFKTKSWLSLTDISSHRHSLSVSAGTMHILKGELEVLALDVFMDKYELLCMSDNTIVGKVIFFEKN